MAAVIAGFKGTVTEVQEATRFALAGARAIVGDLGSFKPTSTGVRGIQIAAGSALVCGVALSESASQVITLPANTSSTATRLDVVFLRFTWAGDNSAVVLASKQGVLGSSTPPALQRVPGGVYEFPLAVVRVRPGIGSIAASDVMDVRVSGGFGGPFQIAQTEYANIVDLPVNAELQSGATLWRVSANDGAGNTTLTVLAGVSYPWIAYDPMLWTGNRVMVNAGAGAIRRGFYQLDPTTNTCHIKFELRKGTGAKNYGSEPFGIDLPAGIRPTSAFADQWGEGMLNTDVGDGFYNWIVKYLIRRDQFNVTNYVVPYATTAGNDCRLLPMRSSGPNGAYDALPRILDAPGGSPVFLDPNVITGAFSYIVE